jgi:hypothetical protein
MAKDFNRDWALRLAEAGIAVFPCNADKQPLVKWRNFSSSDVEAVAEWWHQHPNALPGIDLEKCDLFVLDGDRHGGPDGRAALRDLLQQQAGFDWHQAPTALTPKSGVHVYFAQNGHELGNARGDLPPGVDARGCGGYVIAPYAVLPDGRCYQSAPGSVDLITAFKTGSIPHVPQGIVDLVQARKQQSEQQQPNSGAAGVREQAYAQAALEGAMAELAATASGGRNEALNAIAYRLGRMVARGWLQHGIVEGTLLGAMYANGYVAEEGIAAAAATLRSGLDAGEKEPHPDLREREEEPPHEAAAETPQHPPCTLADVHKKFRHWFGADYDTDVIDAVMAAGAAERLAGDPPWLLVISGPGNSKTETVQALAGAGALVISTIASEGALLSASPRKSRSKNANGGLLRQIGDRGILAIKDVTSILSADRNTRGAVLAGLREVHDGRWQRNVGSDGGLSLTWEGRIVVVGAVTTAWDAAYGVVSVMGDRFVSIRSDTTRKRREAGTQAICNTGSEIQMRAELAAAVGGLIGTVIADKAWTIEPGEIDSLIKAADIVTYARTAVERDYRGDVINSHAPEMPTRFSKQLAQLMRGGLALGMDRKAVLRLALRCARDSIPTLRRDILLDLAAAPRARALDVCRRIIKPLRTVRRELEALHTLGLLHCDEEQSATDENKTIWRYSLAAGFDRETLLTMCRIALI